MPSAIGAPTRLPLLLALRAPVVWLARPPFQWVLRSEHEDARKAGGESSVASVHRILHQILRIGKVAQPLEVVLLQLEEDPLSRPPGKKLCEVKQERSVVFLERVEAADQLMDPV